MQALRFLVVDDATFIRDMVKKQLRDAFPGAEIVDVSSAVRAQAALKTHRFDLILCDWEMPEMSGEEFLRWLRAHPDHGALPFIMVSSRGERDFVVKAVQAGVNDYLGKPFKPEMLIGKIHKVLTRAGYDPGTLGRGQAPGNTQGIANASVAVLTGKAEPAAATKAAPRKTAAHGQALLTFSDWSTQCVIKDISLQVMSAVLRREERLPGFLEQVVVSIVEGDGSDVARLNGYVHAIQAGENRPDTSTLKLIVRFVDDDPAKLDLLSRYIGRR
jgi:CheY-like chemotaxis protein